MLSINTLYGVPSAHLHLTLRSPVLQYKIKDNHIHVREIVQDKKLGFFVFKPYAEVLESRVVV